MKARKAMYLAANALLALLISALHAAAVMEDDKSLAGEEAPAGQLRDHDYYKVELQKLEESTRRIHEEVDRILKEFRKNMEEYYQRTRDAAATTKFAEFKSQPLVKDVEKGNKLTNLQLSQKGLRPLSPAPKNPDINNVQPQEKCPPMPSGKAPPPPINKMGERKKYNQVQPPTKLSKQKPEKVLYSGSVVSREGIQKGLASSKEGENQQSAGKNETGLISEFKDAFSRANLSANTKFLHQSILEGTDEKEWETADNSFEPKVQEKKPTTATDAPPETNEEKLKNLEKAIAATEVELSGVLKEGERPKLSKQLAALEKRRDDIIKKMKAPPPIGSMPLIPPVRSMKEYAQKRQAILEKQDEEDSWSNDD